MKEIFTTKWWNKGTSPKFLNPRSAEWTRSLWKWCLALFVEPSPANTVSNILYNFLQNSFICYQWAHHLYSSVILTVKDQSQPGAKLIFNHASGSAKWRVRVSQDHLGYYLEEKEGDDVGFVFYKKQICFKIDFRNSLWTSTTASDYLDSSKFLTFNN